MIAFNWHYDGEYSFYDMEADQEDLEEFLNKDARADSMYAVTDADNELIGFYNINKITDRIIDIGLGMRPDLTGRGMGLDFLNAGLEFIQSEYKPEKITLSVANFNQRAIKVYRKIGFENIDTYMQDTNGSTFEFLRMEYDCI